MPFRIALILGLLAAESGPDCRQTAEYQWPTADLNRAYEIQSGRIAAIGSDCYQPPSVVVYFETYGCLF